MVRSSFVIASKLTCLQQLWNGACLPWAERHHSISLFLLPPSLGGLFRHGDTEEATGSHFV